MTPKNLLFIFSDEHTREITGCYGNKLVKTPNIDRLATNGTRFDNAYTNCPICVPARASLATGRYVHQIRNWDNAHPYFGADEGWGHRLIDAGHQVTAIGKLHYRSEEDPTGFNEEVETLHVVEGLGDIIGLNRRDSTERGAVKNLALEAGSGDSTYIQYDTRITKYCCDWLRNEAPKYQEKPWVLFAGFVLPHFPLIAPPDFYDMYHPEQMPWPRMYDNADRPDHPVLRKLRQSMNYDKYFDDQKVRIALNAYHGMVSYLDHNIGLLLQTLEECGLADDTRIIYTTDHGDNLGNRGFWGKSVMYEESTAIPMIISGPDVPVGKSNDTAVSLVDCYQTILEGAGLELTEQEQNELPGHSLYDIANGAKPERTVLSEYHAAGSIAAMYMIRVDQWKYVHYVGYAPQLYDLANDPNETKDLTQSVEHKEVIEHCEAKLREIVDPEAMNELAFQDQDAKIEAFGGVEAVRKRGDFGYTPAPGQVPVFD